MTKEIRRERPQGQVWVMAMTLTITAVVVFGFGMATAARGMGVSAMHSQGGTASHSTATSQKAFGALPQNLRASVAAPPSAQMKIVIHKATSTNWAGYADVPTSTGAITEVSSEWFVPSVTCSESSGSAINDNWVGIDGWGTGTVEQLGTAGYCSAPSATPAYYTWWEFYPYNSAQFINTISAGDFIQAYVTYDPAWCVSGSCGLYTLVMSDVSAGISWSVTGGGWICNGSSVCEGGPDGSAECISENTGVLAQFTTTTMYDCLVTNHGVTKGIGGFSSTAMTIYRVNQVGAVFTDQFTSAISNGYYPKSDFVVTWNWYD